MFIVSSPNCKKDVFVVPYLTNVHFIGMDFIQGICTLFMKSYIILILDKTLYLIIKFQVKIKINENLLSVIFFYFCLP